MENDQPTIDQLLKNMGRYQGVAAGPLGEVNFVPDVVIIEG